MPNLNVFFLFNENSNIPISYYRSQKTADKAAKYCMDSPIITFMNVRVEIATLQTAKKAIEDWRTPPTKDRLRREIDSIMWQQNQIRSSKLAKIVDDYLEAQSEYDSNNIRSNFCLE